VTTRGSIREPFAKTLRCSTGTWPTKSATRIHHQKMDTGTTQGSTSPTENQDDPEAAQGIISGGETELRNNIEDMFPKTMGTILKERLSAQTRDTETEYCTVAKLRNITPDVIPPDTLRNIERITKGLSVRLQGLMQSLFPSAPYPSTRGRLNTAKLFRIKTGNPKVFIQKTEASTSCWTHPPACTANAWNWRRHPAMPSHRPVPASEG
jgi:hypothetical protein